MKVSDEMIIAALLSTETNKKAAEQCGLSETQLYKRMRSDSFQAKYLQAKGRILDRVTSTMQNGMNEAARTMLDIMRNDKTASQVRLNAADSIIRNGLRLTEQNEILMRLEALEREKQK